MFKKINITANLARERTLRIRLHLSLIAPYALLYNRVIRQSVFASARLVTILNQLWVTDMTYFPT
jgi:hypothetical protein